MEATEKSITIDIPSGSTTPDVNGRHAGWKAALLLDPNDRSVGLYTAIGSGVPQNVWHRRAILISVGTTASGEAIQELLGEHVDLIEEIFAAYEGSEWDGNNHIGRWTGDEDGPVDALRAMLDDVATLWCASDWLAGDESLTKRQVRAAGPDGLDALAKQIVDDGGRNNALLDEQDVRRCLGWYAEKIAEE